MNWRRLFIVESKVFNSFLRHTILYLNQFALSAILLIACKSENVDPVPDCSGLNLSVMSKADASSCTVGDGMISVTASGGQEPYTYELNSISNSTGSFTGLRGGEYVINVTDVKLCKATIEASIGTTGSTFKASASGTASTECAPDSNGFITVTTSGGVPPFSFKIGNGSFGSSNVFTDLGVGTYKVEAKDSEDCIFVLNTEVPGIHYAAIKQIIDTNCILSGCHNGDNGANRNWSLFENVKENATNIRARTSNKSMPPVGSLSQEQIDLIACWVNEGANN